MNKPAPPFKTSIGATQSGVSLVELMVAMAIGLVVIGAVFTNYLNNSAGSRQTAALTQVTSDASLVLGILRNHIAIAGYGEPTGSDATRMLTNFSGPAVLGCDNGFTNVRDAELVACAEASATPAVGNALLIRYVSDADISPTAEGARPDGSMAQGPTDCTGAAVLPAAGQPSIADNRFHASRIDGGPPSLRCWGNGGASTAPLVENIESLRLHYGIGAPDIDNGKMLRPVRYVTATEVGPLSDKTAWGSVMAVRVCVVVRSAEEVLPAATPYKDCDQNTVSAVDRRIYRAFTTTVLINNRLSGQAFSAS